MKKYFETRYPERLKVLKEELDMITRQITRLGEKMSDDDKKAKLIRLFTKTITTFTENTMYHIQPIRNQKQLTLANDYSERMSPKYLLKYFGEGTKTGYLFKLIYIDKP